MAPTMPAGQGKSLKELCDTSISKLDGNEMNWHILKIAANLERSLTTRLTKWEEPLNNLARLAVAAGTVLFATSALADETFNPTCFTPAASSKGIISYPKKDPPYKIAFVNGYAGNDWRTTAIQSAKAWAARPENKEKLAEFKVVSVGNDSAAQIAAIDNFIAAGYDGISIIAVNPSAFDAVIKRAERAGTVLVPFDNVLDTDKIVQINEDQHQLGAIKAEAVVEAIQKAKGKVEGKILEVSGLPGNSVDRDNHEGMRSVLDKYPGLTVVQVVGNWDAGTVQKVTADAIATQGPFDGVLVQEGTIGAINAMLNANHPMVPIGGDAGNGARMLIAEHKIPGITAAQAPALSAMALTTIVTLLEGNKLPQTVFFPIPQKKNDELVSGTDFYPDLPKSYYTLTGFPGCDKPFTPDELLGQTAENN
jgi:ribose transport system substrate-binding protein